MTREIKKCKGCNDTFTYQSVNGYCSERCRDKERSCLICGYGIGDWRPYSKYCTDECEITALERVIIDLRKELGILKAASKIYIDWTHNNA